jgi:hypothetical protein
MINKRNIDDRVQNENFRPEDFPVGSPQSRAAARALLVRNRKNIQIIVYGMDQPLNLETSTCKRQIWPDGTLFNLIELDGRMSDLTDEQLKTFVEKYPIVDNRGRNFGF